MPLDAGKAQPPFGTGRAGGRAMAVTAAAAAALVLAACGSGTTSLSSDVSCRLEAARAGAAASSVPALASPNPVGNRQLADGAVVRPVGTRLPLPGSRR